MFDQNIRYHCPIFCVLNFEKPKTKNIKKKRKYVAGPDIEPRTSDLRVRGPTDCATRPGIFRDILRTSFLLQKLTRMVVQGQLVQSAVCLSDLYNVFLLDIVRDTKQNLWTTI